MSPKNLRCFYTATATEDVTTLLKESKQWDHPETPFDAKPEIDFVVDVGDLLHSAPDTSVLDKIITEALDLVSNLEEETSDYSGHNGV